MKIISNELVKLHPGNEIESPARVKIEEIVNVDVDLALAEIEIRKTYTSRSYNFDTIKAMCSFGMHVAEVELNNDSLNSVLASVSVGIQALDNEDFALIRPPGHHANLEGARGFCLINNLAVILRESIEQGKKIAIIDFDGHHGDGTHDIFKNNSQVLFCSLFQGGAYPFVTDSDMHNNKNGLYIPLREGGDDRVFKQTMDIFIDKIRSFGPDIVAVSAGFDAYKDDPILGLKFTEDGYTYAGKLIRDIGVKTFAILEGGYHKKIGSCISAFVDGFNNPQQEIGEFH